MDESYIRHLESHLDHVAQHIQGQGTDEQVLEPFLLSPTGYWTSEDKDAFFHGLTIFSRLRPDLIAELIPGKSVLDVCNYLEALEDASLPHRRPSLLSNFEPALEMSEKWIEFEERQALSLTTHESSWEAIARKKMRLKALVKVKESRDEKQLKATKEVEWNQEDYLMALNGTQLRTIDHMFREAEEPTLSAIQNLTALLQTSAKGSVYTDPVIHPALIPLTGSTLVPSPLSETHPGPSLGPEQTKDIVEFHDIDLSSLSPQSRRRHQKRLYMRRKRAEHAGGVASSSVSRLKPGPRARNTVRSGSNLEGRSKHFNPPADASSCEERDVISITEVQDTHTGTVRDLLSGNNLRYKIKAEFDALELSRSELSKHGFGLLHAGNLARLMQFYASFCDAPPLIGTSISAQTIRLLELHAIAFVTDLMHLIISIREQEIELKKHTKIWGVFSNKIHASAVHQALEMMGAMKSKEDHFEALESDGHSSAEDEVDKTMDDDAASIDSKVTSPDNQKSREGEDDSFLKSTLNLPPDTEVFEPLVRHRSYLSAFRHVFHRSALGAEKDDEIAPDDDRVEEDDEENSEDQYGFDDELDSRDREAARKFEDVLWAKFGGGGGLEIPTTANPDVGAMKLRYGEPSAKGIVKSSVFVEDSE